MASIDDIGIDIDFCVEDEVANKEIITEIKSEDKGQTPVLANSDSFHESGPSEVPAAENAAQPEDSSSDDDVDLNAPVGGCNVEGNDDDDGEFDFVITKTEVPEIRVDISKEKSIEDESGAGLSVEESPITEAQSAQKAVVTEHNSSEINGGVSVVKADEKGTPESFPIQWKTAQKEWGDVKDVQLESDDEEEESVTASSTPMISSQEAFNFLKNTDNVLSLHRNQIVTSVQRSGFQAFVHALFGPPRLKRHLIQERDLIFCMALQPYNSSNETHFRMLLSVYKSLTGNNLDCPKFGGHWDAVGFQGDDPGTDFRGTGMLGLLCLLNLACAKADVGVEGDVGRDERCRVRHQLSLSLHRLSRDSEQNFPLAIMSINWTRVLLQTLREGCLNKCLNTSCASRGMQLGEAFLELHAAVAFRFLAVWQRGHKTILDSGLVLRDLEDLVRKNANGLLHEWQAHLAGQNDGASGGPSTKAESGGGRGPGKKRANRYAVGGASAGDASASKDDGVAELSMLN